MTITRLLAGCLAVSLLSSCGGKGDDAAAPAAPLDGLAIQLYTLRDVVGDSALWADNHARVLASLADAGYKAVEAANYAGGKFYGIAPEEYRAQVEAAGLLPLSSHATRVLSPEEIASHDFTEAMQWYDEAIDAHKRAGMEYIVTAWAPLPASLDEARTWVDYHNAIAAKAAEAGLKYGYHTHTQEFDLIPGTDIVWIDYLVENTDSAAMIWQMDTYHAVQGKASPVAYINKYPGRFELIHYKDMYELGQSGMVDVRPITRAAQAAGGTRWYVVEQGEPAPGTTSLDAALHNAQYLREQWGGKAPVSDTARGQYVIADKAQADLSAYPVDDEGYIRLFDGETLSGWRGYGMDEAPASWNVDDGAIHLAGSGTGEAQVEGGGDLIFPHKFKNFELELEYKISKGGNSGIFYLAQEAAVQEDGETVYLPIWQSASEYQVLDNANHEDARLGVDGNRQAASLYDMIPAKPQNALPYGEWNKAKITVYKGTVIHSQNGENVLEYHLWTPKWKEMLRDSKFNKDGEFPCAYNLMIDMGGPDHAGYIGLQDHGDDVWYRNIRVRELE